MSKKVLLGITGGIAAYKAAETARLLIKNGLEVYVVMTANALQYITPLTFDVLTGHKTAYDMYQRDLPSNIPHIDLSRQTDLVLVAPATANIIGKTASGIADDLLSTIIMASTSTKIFAPAMNKEMFNNPIVQRNIKTLKELGYLFIDPGKGELACGEEGIGRLAEPSEIAAFVMAQLKK
jgi:phosphopantothenoylcysteine decarboxylase/phosphopantothenate--cysteine ligase